MPEHGVFFTFEELEWLAALLEDRKGQTNYDIYVKVTNTLKSVHPIEQKSQPPERSQ